MSERLCQMHEWGKGRCDLPATHVKVADSDGVFGWRCPEHAKQERRHKDVAVIPLDKVAGEPVSHWRWDLSALQTAGQWPPGR